ncbi:MAG TPA: hypothetical protein PK867_28705, partial [Pirellulales bacterium]|nr:hypothetical protein [Pirellulales bacterium]
MLRFVVSLTLATSVVCGSLAFAGSPRPKRTVQPRKPAAPAALPAKTATAKPATAKPVPAKLAAAATAADDDAPQAGTKSYKLRYKFRPGEMMRWEVEHRAKVRTTVQGSTQTAETFSSSIKVWTIESVDDQANAKLIYSVERVDMRQKYDGRQETHYNSDTDEAPPPGYDGVAGAVGKPLAELTLNPLGAVVKREERYVQAAPMQENVTLPLPENAVAVGEEWTMPADITVTLPSKSTRKIKARQLYRLDAVDDGLATIHLETQVLTPLNDPAIESQLVQSKANGTVKFDIAAGRILSQQSDVDEHVYGFQGPASNLHYVMRFSEKLLPDLSRAAVYP